MTPGEMYYDWDGNPISSDEWIEIWQRDRVIRYDKYNRGTISTVYIGLDHSFGQGAPLIFETMIFGGEFDGHEWRAATKEEAEKNHVEALRMLRDARGRSYA